MPIYELMCSNEACSLETIERLCSYDDRQTQMCDSCNSLLSPLVSAVAGKVSGGTPQFHKTRSVNKKLGG